MDSPLVDRRIGATALARLLGPPGRPAYRWAADAMRLAVLDGRLPFGTRIPSERELAQALDVSRTTTAAAYEQLRAEGYLRTRRGSGSVTTLPRTPVPGAAGTLGPDTDGPADLAVAAPAAPTALHAAAERALEQLPRHLAGSGYARLGLPALRSLIAERYTRRGTPTEPDEILVTTGAQHAISLLVRTAVGPGDRVAVEHPTYPHALAAVRAAGGRPVAVPVGPSGIDLALLESTLRQASPVLVYCTPDHQNPTGRTLTEQDRADVRGLAERARTLVVGDETLTDLALDAPVPAPFCGPDPGRWVVAVGSASKSFWGGLRVGWVRGPRELVLRLGQERVHHDMATGLLDQLVVAELLLEADEVLAERRERLRASRAVLVHALRAELSWTFDVPTGGVGLWTDLGAPVSTSLAAVAATTGVHVAPGPAFGVDGSFENRLRLPFTGTPAEIRRGVERLVTAWRTLQARGQVGAPAGATTLV